MLHGKPLIVVLQQGLTGCTEVPNIIQDAPVCWSPKWDVPDNPLRCSKKIYFLLIINEINYFE